ncbi:TetR/AcrR family transcriptional regulator [Streptomyces thermoviolaceus]|uniref:TetR/AcrR family transcriptional regulator n=2 Tax=Streptomyces thermoviolaceus TaxID=1952 RepID=UPI0035717975
MGPVRCGTVGAEDRIGSLGPHTCCGRRMARPRNFAEERALDAAMHTFWEKGFEATSTQDLCEATGLRPGWGATASTTRSRARAIPSSVHRPGTSTP